MSKLRRVVNNTVISLIGQAVTWASTFCLIVAYGRFLGDVKYGELFFALSFVALVGFPLEFGFNQQLTRDVAQDPDKAVRYLSATLLLKVLLWPLLYGFILLFCWLLGYQPETRLLVVICGITLLSGAIANTFGSLHYAFERVIFPVVGTVLEKGLSALIGFLLLKLGADVVVIAFVLLGGSLANATWQAISSFRVVKMRLTIDPRLVRELILSSIPFLAYGVLGVIYYRLDTVLLSLETNSAVVGWYGAGYRLFDTLVFLPNIVITAIMYPLLSKFSLGSEKSLKLAIEKSMNFLLFCGIPIATAMVVAAPNIIGFLYHRREFLHSIPALQALAPGLVFLYINTVLTTTLMSIRREKKVTFMAGIALIFNLGLNLYLIPIYQHVGAAAVTSLTELLLLCLATAFTPNRLLPWKSLGVGAKVLAASLVMAFVIYLMRTFSIVAILPVAVIVYLGAALLLRTIPREDIQALYFAVRNKARRASSFDLSQGLAEETQKLPAISKRAFADDEDTLPMRAVRLANQNGRNEDTVPLKYNAMKVKR